MVRSFLSAGHGNQMTLEVVAGGVVVWVGVLVPGDSCSLKRRMR